MATNKHMIDTSHIRLPNDGLDHINVYSKGATEIGKFMSNFAHTPFDHPKFGHFESVESFWYFRGMVNHVPEKELEPLRSKFGFKAKETGKQLREELGPFPDVEDETFPEDVKEAIRCKLRQNKLILNLLVGTSLPLVHYYAYGKGDNAKLIFSPKYDWMIDEISRIREITQQYLKDKSQSKMKP